MSSDQIAPETTGASVSVPSSHKISTPQSQRKPPKYQTDNSTNRVRKFWFDLERSIGNGKDDPHSAETKYSSYLSPKDRVKVGQMTAGQRKAFFETLGPQIDKLKNESSL